MEKDRSLRRDMVKPIFKKELNQVQTPKNINDLLNGIKEITETGVKFIDVMNDIANIKDTIEAQDTLDDKEVKSFGTYAGHIIVPQKYIGKKVKVIIKK